jgi:hypothetical protein
MTIADGSQSVATGHGVSGSVPAISAEPVEYTTKRYRCPFCTRSRSSRKAAAEHMARCWHNPAVRGCKTCRHFEPYTSATDGECCGLGVDLARRDGLSCRPARSVVAAALTLTAAPCCTCTATCGRCPVAEYVVYDNRCGHILGITNDRSLCKRQAQLLGLDGSWRIRTGASDADILSLLRHERCETCSLDGTTAGGGS